MFMLIKEGHPNSNPTDRSSAASSAGHGQVGLGYCHKQGGGPKSPRFLTGTVKETIDYHTTARLVSRSRAEGEPVLARHEPYPIHRTNGAETILS